MLSRVSCQTIVIRLFSDTKECPLDTEGYILDNWIIIYIAMISLQHSLRVVHTYMHTFIYIEIRPPWMWGNEKGIWDCRLPEWPPFCSGGVSWNKLRIPCIVNNTKINVNPELS